MDSNTKGWLIAGAVGLAGLVLFARRAGAQMNPVAAPSGSGSGTPSAKPNVPNVIVAPAQWKVGHRFASQTGASGYTVGFDLLDFNNQVRKIVVTDRTVQLPAGSPYLVAIPVQGVPFPPEIAPYAAYGEPTAVVRLIVDNEVARYVQAHPEVMV